MKFYGNRKMLLLVAVLCFFLLHKNQRYPKSIDGLISDEMCLHL